MHPANSPILANMNGPPTMKLARRMVAHASKLSTPRPIPINKRWQSTTSRTTSQSTQNFWTTGRVLLLSAFTGSLTYLYGVNDTSSFLRKSDEVTVKKGLPAFATRAELEKAIKELRDALGEDAISTDDEDLHRHGFSEWSSINIDTLPIAVAYPKSTEEVSQIAKCCHKYRVPMIPYSGGSSLEANFSCPHGMFPSLDLRTHRMANITKAVSASTSPLWIKCSS